MHLAHLLASSVQYRDKIAVVFKPVNTKARSVSQHDQQHHLLLQCKTTAMRTWRNLNLNVASVSLASLVQYAGSLPRLVTNIVSAVTKCHQELMKMKQAPFFWKCRLEQHIVFHKNTVYEVIQQIFC